MTQTTQPLSPITGGGATAPLDPAAMQSGAEAAPVLQVTKKLSLPTGVASNVKQDVLLVRDCSGSMSGAKIEELNLASAGLAAALADPANKDGFRITVIDFNHGAELRALSEPASGFAMPEARVSGGTNFDAALIRTRKAIQKLEARPNPEGWRYLRRQVLFLSDGHSNVADKNIRKLHELADVKTYAYGDDAARQTLARIASDGEVRVVGTGGSELRAALAEVGKTLSDKLATVR